MRGLKAAAIKAEKRQEAQSRELEEEQNWDSDKQFIAVISRHSAHVEEKVSHSFSASKKRTTSVLYGGCVCLPLVREEEHFVLD